MIFHLGKGKTADDELVREETFRRWREASEKAQSQTNPERAQPQSAPSAAQVQRIPAEIEEIRMDSMRAVEWPDPRSTISLTNEIDSPEVVESVRPIPPAAPKTPVDSNVKGPTSRLAQFVSSGLSALGNAQKPTAAQKSNVEVLRTVDNNPLELERRSAPLPVRTAPATSSPSAAPIAEAGVHLDEDIRRRFGTNIRSALGPGTIIEGTFSFDSPVCIEGTLIGEVRSNSALIVGPQATVNARVKVGTLIVFGIVEGDVEAEELVEVKSGGSLEGDVLSQRFALEDGAWFRGRCSPTSPKRFGQKAEQTELYDTEESEEELDSFSSSDKWTIGS